MINDNNILVFYTDDNNILVFYTDDNNILVFYIDDNNIHNIYMMDFITGLQTYKLHVWIYKHDREIFQHRITDMTFQTLEIL